MAISTHVCQIINIFWKLYCMIIKYFSTMQFPPISTFLKICNYCPRILVIWSIGCTKLRMIKCILLFFVSKSSHDAIFENSNSQTHTFRVNKPLLILEQTTHVMWQNIPWLAMEYFAMSHNISTWQMNILKIFHEMAWNILKRFFHVHLLASLKLM